MKISMSGAKRWPFRRSALTLYVKVIKALVIYHFKILTFYYLNRNESPGPKEKSQMTE